MRSADSAARATAGRLASSPQRRGRRSSWAAWACRAARRTPCAVRFGASASRRVSPTVFSGTSGGAATASASRLSASAGTSGRSQSRNLPCRPSMRPRPSTARVVHPRGIAAMQRCDAGAYSGLDGPLMHATTCTYTCTPDGHFLIDRHPRYAIVIIGSPCSGHGFKFVPVIGEILADLAAREPPGTPSRFLSHGSFLLPARCRSVFYVWVRPVPPQQSCVSNPRRALPAQGSKIRTNLLPHVLRCGAAKGEAIRVAGLRKRPV